MCVWIAGDERSKQLRLWFNPKHFIQEKKEKKKKTIPATLPPTINSTPGVSFFFFFCFAFSLHQYMNFPLKAGALLGDRVKVDGSCPFCSGGQVWADNCQVCAAESDDYRLYCLSQAQSTLIQQSHLYLIYESLCLFLSYLTSFYTSSLYAFSFLLWLFLLSVYLGAHCDYRCAIDTARPYVQESGQEMMNGETNSRQS